MSFLDDRLQSKAIYFQAMSYIGLPVAFSTWSSVKR